MKKTKSEILNNAMNSFDFDYSISSASDNNRISDEFFKDANKHISNIVYMLKEVDYFA